LVGKKVLAGEKSPGRFVMAEMLAQ
jgi:hypothetical protein